MFAIGSEDSILAVLNDAYQVAHERGFERLHFATDYFFDAGADEAGEFAPDVGFVVCQVAGVG